MYDKQQFRPLSFKAFSKLLIRVNFHHNFTKIKCFNFTGNITFNKYCRSINSLSTATDFKYPKIS